MGRLQARLGGLAGAALWLGALALPGEPPANSPPAPAGVPQQYQRLFVKYADTRSISDTDQTAIGLVRGDIDRTFALVCGVSQYPLVEPGADRSLPQAGVDMDKLVAYLKTEAFADEIVLLRDGDVTFERLNYFLTTYFPQRLRDHPHSRLLVTFSGHGLTMNDQGYLLLPTATSLVDKANTIPVRVFRGLLDEILDSGYQVLILLNSCYGGSFMQRRAFAGSRYSPRMPGEHAITAGGSRERTWALEGAAKGSVFFEKVLAGARGAADTYPVNTETGARGDGVVTVEELFGYLRQEVTIATSEIQNPQMGDLSREGSTGGFFFLAPNFRNPPVPSVQRAAVANQDSFGPRAAVAADFSLALFDVQGNPPPTAHRFTGPHYKLVLGAVPTSYTTSLLLVVHNSDSNSHPMRLLSKSANVSAVLNDAGAWVTSSQIGGGADRIMRITFSALQPQQDDRVSVESETGQVFDVTLSYQVREGEIGASAASGMRPSGARKDFSAPYRVCLPPTAEGYSLIPESVSYRLVGDRQCGAWSECKIASRDESGVCMEFRLQGHDEGLGPGIRESEGQLSARYRLAIRPPRLE